METNVEEEAGFKMQFSVVRLFVIPFLLLSSITVADVLASDTPSVPAGKWVCLGDSITAGALASSPGRCYVSRLQAIAALTHVDLQLINQGLSGFSTGAYAYKPEEKATHIPSDTTLITIMLGTNDTRAKGSPDAIGADAAGNIERLIKALSARVPNAKIVLITPPSEYPRKFTKGLRDAGYDEAGPDKLKAIDKAYAALASRLGLRLIDISDMPAEEDTPEGVHPDDLGHAKLAIAIWNQLTGQQTSVTVEQLEQQSDRPNLTFDKSDIQARIGVVYNDALSNLLDKNTVHPQKPGDEDSLGWMVNPPGTFIRAGGGYNNPWTRDASLNSWFAGSLLEPIVAQNTLWAVCRRQADNSVVIQQDNQWWDQCIWVKGAWNHYTTTGDRTFLEAAYPVATASLSILQREHFNASYGLFMGPAFFADGISAYPPPEYDASNHGSFVLDHRHTRELMVLSTNCVYREALRCAARMARALERPESEATDFDRRSDELKKAINQHLWSPGKHAYAYFISSAGPDAGKPFFAQEGIGQAYALLFDIADADQVRSIVRQIHAEPKGIPTLWPNLPEFDDAHPGRHNVMLWPLVNGLWAQAAARVGATEAFATEVNRITDLVLGSDHNFFEIYNPRTGKPDGGWQNGGHWGAVPDQTWSATAYIGAIHYGLFGISFTPEGITFSPVLPRDWGSVTLANFHYQQMNLTVHLTGSGTVIHKATLDGTPWPNHTLSSKLAGNHKVDLELADR